MRRRALSSMSKEEALIYVADLRDKLAAKQRREQAYLARRKKAGRHTPTDDAYEADQLLENELLAMLDHLIKELQQ